MSTEQFWKDTEGICFYNIKWLKKCASCMIFGAHCMRTFKPYLWWLHPGKGNQPPALQLHRQFCKHGMCVYFILKVLKHWPRLIPFEVDKWRLHLFLFFFLLEMFCARVVDSVYLNFQTRLTCVGHNWPHLNLPDSFDYFATIEHWWIKLAQNLCIK